MAEHVAPARLLPMVKADGYGLGAVEVARALAPLGPYAFGVATAEEGGALRRAGIRDRVIVFSPASVADPPSLLVDGLDAAVMSLASLETLETAARRAGASLDLHLEIDTGMGRAGLLAAESTEWAPAVASLVGGGSVSLASAYTHFHSAGVDDAATEEQLRRFRGSIAVLEAAGVPVPLVHAANSDAVISDRQYHLGLVRPGIYLYGGRRRGEVAGPPGDPEGVARVRARVLEVRDLAAGSTVSYGATHITRGRERLATLAIGYADGLSWRLSNRGEAIIDGIRVPIRGAVCMDVTSVDVSAVSGVVPWTVATLLGRDGDEEITLGDLAEIARTIEHEVLTAIGRRLPRRYTGGHRVARERNT